MSIVFQMLGIGCLIVAGAALLLTPAIFIEPRSIAENWATDVPLIALACALTGLLMLGFASTLNILHDMRHEVGLAAAALGNPAPSSEPAPPAAKRPADPARSALAAPRETATAGTDAGTSAATLETLPPGVIRFPQRPAPQP